MAGTAVSDFEVFLDALADQVAFQTDVIMGPIQEVHNFVTLAEGAGQDAVIFPYASGALAMGAVTDGTAYTTTTAAPILGETVTPAPYEVQVLISEHAVRQNPANYMEFIANRFAQAWQTQVMTLASVLATNGTVSGSTGADLTTAILGTSIGTVRTQGVGGPLKCLLNPAAYAQLVANASNIATYGGVGQAAVSDGSITRLMGVDIVQDSGVGNDGTDYYNFLGAKDAIGVAVGVEPRLKVLESGDATHIKLASAGWVAAATVAANRGVWLKSDYEG
jgi:hypothetical protein